MVVFKMRDSVPSPRYSPVCNVLRQWKTSLIPTYRVYRLYDIRMSGAAVTVASTSLKIETWSSKIMDVQASHREEEACLKHGSGLYLLLFGNMVSSIDMSVCAYE